jgi:hypothetical protein
MQKRVQHMKLQRIEQDRRVQLVSIMKEQERIRTEIVRLAKFLDDNNGVPPRTPLGAAADETFANESYYERGYTTSPAEAYGVPAAASDRDWEGGVLGPSSSIHGQQSVYSANGSADGYPSGSYGFPHGDPRSMAFPPGLMPMFGYGPGGMPIPMPVPMHMAAGTWPPMGYPGYHAYPAPTAMDGHHVSTQRNDRAMPAGPDGTPAAVPQGRSFVHVGKLSAQANTACFSLAQRTIFEPCLQDLMGIWWSRSLPLILLLHLKLFR